MPKRQILPLLLLLLGFVLLALVRPGIELYTDWLWYREVGHERVFLTELGTRATLFVGVFVLAFAFIAANLRYAQRGAVPDPLRFRLRPDLPPLDLTRMVGRLALPVAGLAAFVLATGTAGGWMIVQQFIHRVPFGVADPVFGRDIGYYVFTLPALATAAGLLMALVVGALVLTLPVYVLRGDVIARPRILVEPSAGLHLGTLLALLFVAVALQTWFVHIPGLLYSTTGPLVGASYSDLHAQLPALRVLAVASLLAAAAVLYGALQRRLVLSAALAAGALFVIGVVGTVAIPAAVQRLIVAPTELTREAPQLEHHLRATRHAWGLDRVQVRTLGGAARLTLDDLAENEETIRNVRLWDREPLLQTFGQLQEIRTYYDFVSVHDDRYWINGQYRQVLLSPRELNSASLPTRTFINEHLTFTHGMGVTLAPVNQVTAEGLPVLFIKDLPPVSNVDLVVTRPGIYYGQLTRGFVVVNTRRPEFDYPAGDANVFTTYDGRGGVRVGGLLRRSLLAFRFGSMTLLLSQDITSDSRILYNRQIQDRARRALPFLYFDGDPYMVIDAAGRLKWILDAYTLTTRYPYAQRLADGTSYMRNSVKVVIDAFDGDVAAYIADPEDAIIRMYDAVFPGILQPLDAMPADLRAHIRYPEDLYRLQTQLYRIYHMDDAETFYHREDQWEIPVLSRGERREPFMRRIIMRLPHESRAEYIFMTQFTPTRRDNLAAWMVARNDGDHYGELIVYRFPRQSLVFGPQQVVNRINQDTEIARQISLWDQRGSQVIRGELLVIPIGEALIYVQPIYLRAEGGRIPELKRVVVAYENQVVMEETLEESLEVLFGVRPPSPLEGLEPSPAEAAAAALPAEADERLRRMQEQYERARVEIERLGELLRQLMREPVPAPRR
jgi:uncharacterized membrane protein (UPF0182 family)